MDKIFSYNITTERPIKELIELRFKYVLERTKLTVEDFVKDRFLLNDKSIQTDTVVYPNDILTYRHLRSDEAKMDIRIEVLYEDEFMLAIEKPDLIPVVPRSSHYFNSVAFLLKEAFRDEEITPLHRLDIETTGVLLVAKKYEYTAAFHSLFRDKTIEKKYEALVYGELSKNIEYISGFIEKDTTSRIHSKYRLDIEKEHNSFTKVHDVEHFQNKFSKVLLEPISGKTNQLRIHLASIGHPIIGDKKYYFSEEIYLDWLKTKSHHLNQMFLPSQALHAKEVCFHHPFLKKDIRIVSSNSIIDEYVNQMKYSLSSSDLKK